MYMNMVKEKTIEDILNDIKSGKYRNFYLIYNRKSTDEAENQKNSISYQKAENTRFANKEGLPLAPVTIKNLCVDGIISERHSGFKESDLMTITADGLVQYHIDRPKFHQMAQFLNEGYFKGIIVLCWDRISRNKGDDMVIRRLMRKGIDVRFVYTKYDKSSNGELHMDVDGVFSQHHSRVTREKVTLTIKHSRQKGLCTYRAPFGYLNPGEMEHKPFDPERADFVRDAYKLYVTGEWSLSDLARLAKERNITTVPMRRRRTKDEMLAEEDEDGGNSMSKIPKTSRLLTENHISRMLKNRFYLGQVLDENKQYIKSNSHEALIDEDTFYRVQALLAKKKVSIHYTEKLDLPLRGIARCEHCERVYTPYPQKGIEYFGSRCRKDCPNTFRSFNFEYLSNEIGALISKLYFTDDEIADMDARVGTEIALLEEKRLKNINQDERKKKAVREKLTYLRSNKLALLQSGVYTPESWMEEETKLSAELLALQTNEQISDEAMHETMKDIQKLSELIKDVIPTYEFANPYEKEKIVRIIFSELYISQNSFKYRLKKGFECFENRLNAKGDPTGNRTRITALKRPCPNR